MAYSRVFGRPNCRLNASLRKRTDQLCSSGDGDLLNAVPMLRPTVQMTSGNIISSRKAVMTRSTKRAGIGADETMLDDREFGAAEPSHDLAVARQSFQSPRNRHQHHVASSMTMMIVSLKPSRSKTWTETDRFCCRTIWLNASRNPSQFDRPVSGSRRASHVLRRRRADAIGDRWTILLGNS